MSTERKERRAGPAGSQAGRTLGEDTGDGAIRISENVISAIVRKYTLEVEGVVRFASNSIVGGLAEMIGRKTHDSNIVVELEGETVSISVNLVLAFGVKIPEVAATVQEAIRTKVTELTGKQVAHVSVTVQDLDDPGKNREPSLPGLMESRG